MIVIRARRLVLGAILTSLASTVLSGQQLTLPDWMRSSARDLPAEVFPAQAPAQTPSPTPAPAVDVTYADEPFVIQEARTRVRFENDGTGRREVEARVRVQSEAGVERWGQLIFVYSADNERLAIDRVEVRKPSGEVVVATADSVQDLAMPVAGEAPVYSDFRQRHVTVPSLRPGDTLSYHATYTGHTAFVPGQFWFGYSFTTDAIVVDEQLALDLPADRQLILKAAPGLAAMPTVAAGPGRVVHAWHASHLTREKQDAKQGAKDAKQEAADERSSAVQLTTFRSWDEVARWYADLAREPARADEAIKAKAQELTRGRATPVEKLEALSDYVAHTVRYVSLSFGMGRYVPHRAADVLANQYGDCKDKHTLLAALASAVGLEVLPVLASSTRPIDRDVPSPGQFDHVISVMPAGTDRAAWIWTDTTAAVAPFRRLMPVLRGQTLSLAAASPQGGLIETPKRPPVPDVERVTVTGTLSELGKLDTHVSVDERSDAEMVLRAVLLSTPRARWPALGEGLAKASWIGGTVTDVTPSDPLATHDPLRLDYRRVRESYVAWDNGRYRMPVPWDRLSLPAPTEDYWKGDAAVPLSGSELQLHLQLTLPASITAQAPVDVSVSRDYADYQTTYRVEGHTISVDRAFHWKAAELPIARAADYLAFVRAIRADEEQRFELELKAGATTSPSSTANASSQELHEAARTAYRNGHYAESIALYKRVIALEPKHQTAWNNMGLSQMALDQLDDAEASFRKQIEINAFDQWSYNNLGQVLRRRRQYDEAAVAFRKQLEINPLDQFAYKNLGGMANERQQYPEARAALEKAVGITPNDASLRILLGEVYLRLKMAAEAGVAFDKAVQIAPVPPTWNSIAYVLAQNDVQLDRALQYAESAVNGSATVLRQMTLPGLTPAHLRVVLSLAAAWDTLGWVHFKRGDLATADRYL
jgi:tetratricopeptide (TPR) repeat protein/transglutaminase-like putative cysteine protease